MLLLGFRKDFFAIRLLSLTLAHVISNMLLQINKNNLLSRILSEESPTADRTIALNYGQRALLIVKYIYFKTLPVGLMAALFIFSISS